MTPANTPPSDLDALALRLSRVMVKDRARLEGLLRRNDPTFDPQLAAAEARVESRTASVPPLTFPPDLPVSALADDIVAVLREHRVVVIAGETGSGKSTQLPKLLLAAGRGTRGLIGHTQPRRLAARTVAERIASEVGETVGASVGYAVRFDDRVSERTLVKVMTDGILLAELQRDPDLRAYDAIIIDEAHERSLNIDFLLGYLHRLRTRRPDLQIVITSATIDTERFANHFATDGVPAPIITVSGRTFPVEVRYRPFGDDPDAGPGDERDQVQAISDAIDELCKCGPGDILVFLSGEREIRDTAQHLDGVAGGRFDVLPLYARLSAADQHRIFADHAGRRVVLATNVAETSLTVPGIRYVVDAGLARISRYSRRLKVQRLPIEAISQASANQRSGRCGRVAPGIAVRLYSEASFASRPEFTEPEILRTNLASVILRMAAIKLGSIEGFGFVEPPDRRTVRDGIALLEELGALAPGDGTPDERLTKLGKRLATLPVDPRLGRMVLEADRLGCTREVLIIVSALSILDPRERPRQHAAAADELHRRFADERSDFMAWLALWDYVKEQQRSLSGSQFRKRCRAEFLNFLRIREWHDVHAQLRSALHQAGVHIGPGGGHSDAVHQALLSGLLSHIGRRTDPKPDRSTKGAGNAKRPPKRQQPLYLGTHGASFVVAPGSSLTRSGSAWVMASELVETEQLRARMVAAIDPLWLEQVGGHLCVSAWSDPRYDDRQGAAVITQRVTIYGLTIVAGRTVQLSRLDPPLARELFIRHGLAEGRWTGHHNALKSLAEAKRELNDLAARARNDDADVAEDRLEQLFAARLPDHVLSARTFDQWWKKTGRDTPGVLHFVPRDLQRPGAPPLTYEEVPDRWELGSGTGASVRLSYVHDLTAENDGVTAHIPLTMLDHIDAGDFAWHVGAYRRLILAEVLRALPKELRRAAGPVPDAVVSLERQLTLERPRPPFRRALVNALMWLTGLEVHDDEVNLGDLPEHLTMRFQIEREDGTVVATGRNLGSLQKDLRRRTSHAIGDVFADLAVGPATSWTFDQIPAAVTRQHEGLDVIGYPALIDCGSSGARVGVLSTSSAAARAHHGGVRRLLLQRMQLPMKQLLRSVGATPAIALALGRYGSMSSVLDDCADAALDAVIAGRSADVRDAAAFESLVADVRAHTFARANAIASLAGRILQRVGEIETRLDSMSAPTLTHAVNDIGIQVDRLILPGFVSLSGEPRLHDIVRYLDAVMARIETLGTNPARDRERTATVQALERRYEDLLANLPTAKVTAAVGQIRWMLEEFRIAQFAQQLGTQGKVSEKRILEAIAACSQD